MNGFFVKLQDRNFFFNEVAGTRSLSADGLIMTFTPSAPLLTNRDYRFRFSGEVRDLAGNHPVTIGAGSEVVATGNDRFFDFTTGSQ